MNDSQISATGVVWSPMMTEIVKHGLEARVPYKRKINTLANG